MFQKERDLSLRSKMCVCVFIYTHTCINSIYDYDMCILLYMKYNIYYKHYNRYILISVSWSTMKYMGSAVRIVWFGLETQAE